MEPLVGSLRTAFARKHARGVLAVALEWVNTGSVGKFTGNVFLKHPPQQIAPRFERRRHHTRNALLRQRDGVRGNLDGFAAHVVHVFVCLVLLAHLRPRLKRIPEVRIQVPLAAFHFFLNAFDQSVRIFQFGGTKHLQSSMQRIKLIRHAGLIFYPLVVRAVVFRNLGKVPGAVRRNDVNLLRHFVRKCKAGRQLSAAGLICNRLHHRNVQAVGAGIVELAGHGSVHRHVLQRVVPAVVVPLDLFLYIAQRIQCTAFVELIEGNQVRKIQHVDLLQLRSGPVFGGHDVQRSGAVLQNFRVGLADSTGFQDHQVKPSGLNNLNGFCHVTAQGQVALPGCQRAHVHVGVLDGVHADAVA